MAPLTGWSEANIKTFSCYSCNRRGASILLCCIYMWQRGGTILPVTSVLLNELWQKNTNTLVQIQSHQSWQLYSKHMVMTQPPVMSRLIWACIQMHSFKGLQIHNHDDSMSCTANIKALLLPHGIKIFISDDRNSRGHRCGKHDQTGRFILASFNLKADLPAQKDTA